MPAVGTSKGWRSLVQTPRYHCWNNRGHFYSLCRYDFSYTSTNTPSGYLALQPNQLPGAANCTFEVSYPGPRTRSTGRQKQSPEPLPPESPIYCGTEIEEGRLSVENVARIESKRVKALSAHFIDSLFNEEINR